MTKEIETDDIRHLAETLAGRLQTTPEAATRLALHNELQRREPGSLRERLQPLFDRIDARPRGPEADKAFFDSLNDE